MTTQMEKRTTREMTAAPKQELSGAESTRPEQLFTPAVDIFETENEIVVMADMPGVEADGLTIDLRDSVLTINGTVSARLDDGERWLLQEYGTGSFYRQFRLSNVIDQERIDAAMKHGVLRLTLPKAEAARPRKIEVRQA